MATSEYEPSTAILSALALIGLALASSMFYVLVYPAKPPVIPGVPVAIPSGVSTDTTLNFDPTPITVHVGQAVQWSNKDDSPHTSTATSVPGGTTKWDSSELDPGDTFTTPVFTIPGNYAYHCIFHPAWMRGTIIVTSS